VRAGDFLLAELRGGGRWRRSWQGGRARHLAYAGDYAWLVEAFTRLAEATGQARWVAEARTTAAELIELFQDGDGAGLFTTGHDAERLVVRQKDCYDGATPSANSVAALALARLGALTGDAALTERATTIGAWLATPMAAHPTAFAYGVVAADLADRGVTQVAVTGDRPDLVAAGRRPFLPAVVLAWGEPYDSPLWEGRTGAAEAGRAYVCRDYACLAPVTTVEALTAQLVPRA
ncbi:MAG: thioredoxin domain-containing protein, partial [Acidimicrobiales bacterium]